MKKIKDISNRTVEVFNQSFFVAMTGIVVLVGVAGLITAAVFGELGKDFPMPVYVVVLRFLLLIFCFAAVALLFVFFSKRIMNSSSKLFESRSANTVFIFACVGVLFALQLVVAFCLKISPITDVKLVDSYAQKIVNDNSFACLDSDFNNHYLIRYQNNIPILLVIAAVYKLSFMLTGSFSHTPLTVLSSLSINIAVLLTVLTSRRLFGERKAVVTLLLCVFFTPYYTFSPYYYTDSFSIPFVAATLFTFVVAVQSQGRVKKALFLALSGAMCVTAFALKGSAAILLAALLIYLPLRYGLKSALKMGAVFVLSFLIIFSCGSIAWKKADIISEQSSDRYQFPTIHWVMLGLNRYGAYTSEDGDISKSFTNMKDRKAGEIKEIKSRLKNYGFFGTVGHLGYKVVWTYMDGTYYVANYLGHYEHRTPIHSLVLYDGKYRFAFYSYSFGYQMFLFLMMALSAKKARKKREKDEGLLFRIAVVGMILFFMIWETNARYPFNFTPLFILLASSVPAENFRFKRLRFLRKGDDKNEA